MAAATRASMPGAALDGARWSARALRTSARGAGCASAGRAVALSALPGGRPSGEQTLRESTAVESRSADLGSGLLVRPSGRMRRKGGPSGATCSILKNRKALARSDGPLYSHDEDMSFVRHFRQASPYIEGHRGKTFLIQIPGEVISQKEKLEGLIQDLALLHDLGVRLVLVVGAGLQINELLLQQGKTPHFAAGYRVTDEETMRLATLAAGMVRTVVEAQLSRGPAVPALRRHGNAQRSHGPAVKVVSGNFITAKRRGVVNGIDYGETGEVRWVESKGIQEQLDSGHVVLINHLGFTAAGEILNCSTYEVAVQTAIQVGADKMFIVLDGETIVHDTIALNEDSSRWEVRESGAGADAGGESEGAGAGVKVGVPSSGGSTALASRWRRLPRWLTLSEAEAAVAACATPEAMESTKFRRERRTAAPLPRPSPALRPVGGTSPGSSGGGAGVALSGAMGVNGGSSGSSSNGGGGGRGASLGDVPVGASAELDDLGSVGGSNGGAIKTRLLCTGVGPPVTEVPGDMMGWSMMMMRGAAAAGVGEAADGGAAKGTDDGAGSSAASAAAAAAAAADASFSPDSMMKWSVRHWQIPGCPTELSAAVYACRKGVSRCHLVDANVDGSLILELYTRDGVGTMISSDIYEGMRAAVSADVKHLADMLQPLELEGTLKARSEQELLLELPYFTIVERDNKVLACAALLPWWADGAAEVAAFVVHPSYRGEGRGDSLLDYLEQKARARGIHRLFLLTTRTADWFAERGFAYGGPAHDCELLPQGRRAQINPGRNSKCYVKDLIPMEDGEV